MLTRYTLKRIWKVQQQYKEIEQFLGISVEGKCLEEKWPEADLLKWMVSCLKYLSTTKTCHLFYSTRMILR